MSEQEQQREYYRYQEWQAEDEARQEEQYHIYLEDRIAELKAQLTAGCEDMDDEFPRRTCGLADKYDKRIEELEETLQAYRGVDKRRFLALMDAKAKLDAVRDLSRKWRYPKRQEPNIG